MSLLYADQEDYGRFFSHLENDHHGDGLSLSISEFLFFPHKFNLHCLFSFLVAAVDSNVFNKYILNVLQKVGVLET